MVRADGTYEFTEATATALNEAVGAAASIGSQELHPVHVARSLLSDRAGIVSQVAKGAQADTTRILQELSSAMQRTTGPCSLAPDAELSSAMQRTTGTASLAPDGKMQPTPSLRRALHSALQQAQAANEQLIAADQLLVWVCQDQIVSDALERAGSSAIAMKNAVESIRARGDIFNEELDTERLLQCGIDLSVVLICVWFLYLGKTMVSINDSLNLNL
ncbi:hypothetical protein T484DRAFT_1762109 [Baffinella frigidus]|nr:hypothetical protein T484DRAFT_1762109 [Cryptophyta sp. CCMP2293]